MWRVVVIASTLFSANAAVQRMPASDLSAAPSIFKDAIELLNFLGPATFASASMTALALNAGTSEWFYLSDWSKSQASNAIKQFESTTRVSLSSNKTTFFCSTLMYLQGAALAIEQDNDEHINDKSSATQGLSVASSLTEILAAYPSAEGYKGFCVQLFPTPLWRETDAPCQGEWDVPREGVAGVALFSILCLAASEFDFQLISPNYRGGVSALNAFSAPVAPRAGRPLCEQMHNSDMLVDIAVTSLQLFFTQLMVGPVAAMLTMEVKDVCSLGTNSDACMRFENVMGLFFESLSAATDIKERIAVDVTCFFLRKDRNIFDALP